MLRFTTFLACLAAIYTTHATAAIVLHASDTADSADVAVTSLDATLTITNAANYVTVGLMTFTGNTQHHKCTWQGFEIQEIMKVAKEAQSRVVWRSARGLATGTSQTLSCTWTTASKAVLVALVWTGIDPDIPLVGGQIRRATGDSNGPITVDMESTVSGNLVVDFAAWFSSASPPQPTVGAGQTQHANLNAGAGSNSGWGLASSELSTGGTVTMSWDRGAGTPRDWLTISGELMADDGVSDCPTFPGRKFQTHSTWYEKIPANPTIHPNSANVVQHLKDVFDGFAVGRSGAVPTIWQATGSTPTFNFSVTNADTLGFGWEQNVPVPVGAEPSSGADGVMAVFSEDGNTLWEMRGVDLTGPTKIAERIRKWDTRGDGIDEPTEGANLGLCKAPRNHGLIRLEQIETTKVINHALAFSTVGIRQSSTGLYPCINFIGGSDPSPDAPEMGFRFQYDPTIDVDALPILEAHKIMLKAAQVYGIILVDQTQAVNVLKAESFVDPDIWNNILTENLTAIDMSDFRLLADGLVPPHVDAAMCGPSEPPPGNGPTLPVGTVVGTKRGLRQIPVAR